MISATQIAGLLWILPEPQIDELVFDKVKYWLTQALQAFGDSAIAVMLQYNLQKIAPSGHIRCREAGFEIPATIERIKRDPPIEQSAVRLVVRVGIDGALKPTKCSVNTNLPILIPLLCLGAAGFKLLSDQSELLARAILGPW
jgi:hypothetical protein